MKKYLLSFWAWLQDYSKRRHTFTVQEIVDAVTVLRRETGATYVTLEFEVVQHTYRGTKLSQTIGWKAYANNTDFGPLSDSPQEAVARLLQLTRLKRGEQTHLE
jgi:hypothetical protein